MIKLRNSTIQTAGPSMPIAPLLGVVFLLLAFYLLNLKIASRQFDYSSHLPLIRPRAELVPQHRSEIKVGLRSDRAGNLTQLTIGSHDLGNDDRAFERLNQELLKLIGRTGCPLTSDVEVEIDADFETQYQYIVKAVTECTGRLDPDGRQIARYVEKVKFAPPHKPKG